MHSMLSQTRATHATPIKKRAKHSTLSKKCAIHSALSKKANMKRQGSPHLHIRLGSKTQALRPTHRLCRRLSGAGVELGGCAATWRRCGSPRRPEPTGLNATPTAARGCGAGRVMCPISVGGVGRRKPKTRTVQLRTMGQKKVHLRMVAGRLVKLLGWLRSRCRQVPTPARGKAMGSREGSGRWGW
eukprot:364944-Chlamydomonas_euryale.AAC.11